MKKEYICKCSAQYKRAIRVNYKSQEITFHKLGTSANRNVFGVWCERCGSLEINYQIHFPMARVIEDIVFEKQE